MGGGAMRAVAKVAGITVANGGIRGITSDQYPVFSATRRAAYIHSTTTTVEDVKLVAPQCQTGLKTTSEIEGWVFAETEETILNVDGDVMMPRVVLGGSPTLEEAKEATSELAIALEKAFLSSTDSVASDVISKSGVTSENRLAPAAVPVHAIKAFRLLHDNYVVQNVVASIACDPNVWSAVLNNPELQDFMQSQRACFSSSNENHLSDDDNSDVSSECSEAQLSIGVMDIVEKIKITVVDMMSNLSVYFHTFFGDDVNKRVFASSDRSSSAEKVMETSFMGLAVMAIMVILVKRDE